MHQPLLAATLSVGLPGEAVASKVLCDVDEDKQPGAQLWCRGIAGDSELFYEPHVSMLIQTLLNHFSIITIIIVVVVVAAAVIILIPEGLRCRECAII